MWDMGLCLLKGDNSFVHQKALWEGTAADWAVRGQLGREAWTAWEQEADWVVRHGTAALQLSGQWVPFC